MGFFSAAADLARGLVGQNVSYLFKRWRNNCKKPRYLGSHQQTKTKTQTTTTENNHEQERLPRDQGEKGETVKLTRPKLKPSLFWLQAARVRVPGRSLRSAETTPNGQIQCREKTQTFIIKVQNNDRNK